MNHYKATNTDTQEVVEYDADAPLAEHLLPPWVVEVVITVVPVAPAVPTTVYGGRRVLDVREFMWMFTASERVAIRAAASSNSTLADFMDLMYHGNTVNLDAADTVTGVNLLEQAGIIAAGRAAQVLAG